ncbi:MAG: hypothetical protein QOD53_947, partial [Thermoleophilaceae bacterium]|nr:hypothetical protein [Thermoleophilaceae bacterium]
RQPMSLLRARPHLTPSDTWQVARRTGELDLRATLGFKRFLTRLAHARHLTALQRAAIRQVASWDGTAFYPDGAERSSAGAETGNVAAPGFAILSAWFHALESRAAAPIFGPVVPGPNFAAGVRSFTQTPQTTSPEFEFFDDYDAFLYKVMTGARGYHRYLGRRSAAGVSRAALDVAVAKLSSAQGRDPSRWRAAMPQIAFQSLDVADLPSVPWENRGTWGQAIALGVPRRP